MTHQHTDILALYARRAQTFRDDAVVAARKVRAAGGARLVMFLGAMLLAVAALAHPQGRVALGWGAVAIAACFAAGVAQSRRLRARRDRLDGLAHLTDQAAARATRDWSAITPTDWHPATIDPAAADLDVFGLRSLVQLLPPLTAAPGRSTMAHWLATPAAPDTIAARQRAAAELAPKIDFRDELSLAASRVRASESRVRQLIEWTTSAPIGFPRWAPVASVVLPAATLLGVVLQYEQVTRFPLWLVTIVLGGALSRILWNDVRAQLDTVDALSPTASAYETAFTVVAREHFDDAELERARAALLGTGDRSAMQALRRLARIAAAAEVRASPMLHVVLQTVLLWDCHVAFRLDAWRRDVGADVERWFDALGEVECCAAFGALLHANPDWTFPSVSMEHAQFDATALGHPLLPETSRVSNDVVVGPRGTVGVISGSNMSGKSTLLRAVGLNALLARAGAPVCARRLVCPPLRVLTSIGVQDSVHDGISYFMAELRRLRDVVAGAELDTGPALYLIDEMLRGTNAEERAVATRIVVERLLNTGAVGLVTTHDAATFDDPSVAAGVRHGHFQECFAPAETGGEPMYFDYLLRSGPATSRNALRLLSLVGISKVE